MTPSKTPQKNQNARLTSIALSTLIGLSLSACAFSENPGAGTPPPVKTSDVLDTLQTEKDKEVADGKLTIENVSVTFEENPSPASYRMVVRWPKSIQHVTISVNSRLPVVVRNADFAEFAVISDTEYHVQIIAYGNVSSSPLSSLELTAKSPYDFLIEKQLEYSEATVLRARRIFFFPKGRIVTNGKPLSIETEKLYVPAKVHVPETHAFENRSHIVTHARDTLAKDEADLAGGNISIQANEAHGHLFVALIGVNGVQGPSGTEVESKMETKPSRDPRVDASLNGIDGVETLIGTKCPVGKGFSESGCGMAKACTTPPTSGSDGSKGDDGTQGGKGGNGGSYGKFVISVKDGRNFLVDVGTMPGLGGPGGDGAPGFPGTLGGRAGAQPGSCSAFQVTKGNDGGVGEVGKPGDPGDPSSEGSYRGDGVTPNVYGIKRDTETKKEDAKAEPKK